MLLLFVAVIIIVDTLVGDRGLLATLRARKEYDELTLAIARQHAENARLWDQVRRLNDDPSTIEEIARRELGLIRPGEKLFIVKDVPSPSVSGLPSASQGVAPAASAGPSPSSSPSRSPSRTSR
jgi:cell division protein FtsB